MPDSLLIIAQFLTTPADAQQRKLDSGLIKQTVTLTGDIAQGPIQLTIGTSELTLTIPTDIGADGHLLMRNIDDNTVHYGTVTAVYPFQVQPNEPAIVQMQGSPTLFLIAIGSPARVEFSWVKK